MQNSLADTCVPRNSVFDPSIQDTVYSIDDLAQIDPHHFFEENFVTDGMKQLLTEVFKRMESKSPSGSGVYLLSQAMGGGKTHNLLALGLLAKHPYLRSEVMGSFYTPRTMKDIRVVTFSGRNTNTPYGIWGEIAKSLNKQDVFSAYYTPLMPPSDAAWVELLRGEPVLLMLDELPPYFEAMRARPVGNTTMDTITTTALSNLFNAIASGKLPNVCLVLTDLRASSYGAGSAALNAALQDLSNEANRLVMRIDPVKLNSDELYDILRTRLFASTASPDAIDAIAAEYGQTIAECHAMGLTTTTDAQERASIKNSYPVPLWHS
jgi:predicted AAA+ superfamily ATPase